jgi:hypothetical protein
LREHRLLLVQIVLQALIGQTGKHLPTFHAAADIHQQLRDAQATGLRADDDFLPGRQGAVGLDGLRPGQGWSA